MRVPLSQWVRTPEITPEKQMSHTKMFFFDPKYLKVPEFMFDNAYISFKEAELNMLVDHLTQQEEEAKFRKQQEEASK